MFGIDDAVLGAGIGAVGNIFSSRQANSANRQATSMQTMTNLYEGAQARQFNAQQAELSRNWSAQQAATSRDYNAQEAVNARQFDQGMFNQASAFNSAEAQKGRDFAAGQSQKQMDFQERMRGTQYQTAMADMRASGLNPILAYSQGGAGTPIGSAATSSAASVGTPTGPAASSSVPGGATASGSPAHAGSPLPYQSFNLPSLLSAALQVAQIDSVKAGTEKTRTEKDLLEGEFIGGRDGTSNQGPSTYGTLEKQERAKLLNRQVSTELERASLTQEQQNLVREEINNAVKTGKRIDADTGNIQVDTVLKSLSQNERRAASKFWGEHPDTYGIQQILKTIGEGVGSAVGLNRIFR
ncbi:MAG: DNA pilot protein [Microvirus sp.]|nr:MAG: DNA pilot protein [Microvirus sp.]